MTRDDLVVLHRTKILTDLLRDGARNGVCLETNIDRHLHCLLREDDALEHQTRDDLMRKLRPHMIKRKR